MAELMQGNVLLLVAALLVGLLVAWWVFAASRRTRVDIAPPTDDQAPARRNQALIDAPAAAKVPVATPPELAGAGEAIAAAASPGPAPEASPSAPAQTAPVQPAASKPSVPPAVDVSPAAPARPAPAAGDELTRIKGLGPKLAQQLRELGVTTLAQIAAWDEADIDRIDAQLGRFQGRIRRDDWQTQARLLAAGDTAGYQARFGKL